MTSFFSDLLTSISERGRGLVGLGDNSRRQDIVKLAETLLSGKGEATGVALASEVLDQFKRADADKRRAFLLALARDFGPDPARLDAAIARWQAEPSAKAAASLHDASEPRRQELIRRLNLAPGGTAELVAMREELFKWSREFPELAALDTDFRHLFSSWFNRGFLMLRQIDWTEPANVLDKVIRYEAVHEIRGWEELRRRIEPADRRLFAFFHPQLRDEPLIFVEVALTRDMPVAIAPLLSEERRPIKQDAATTAVFYSISNCQEGLRGISFGNFLIKQVVEDLRRQLPGLTTFVTLSPVPGFARWLAGEMAALSEADQHALAPLAEDGWHRDAGRVAQVQPVLLAQAARYFLEAKAASGKPVDPVARFHLGNGARLERLNPLGDLSPKALRDSHGLMVNYLYDLGDIEKNHEAYAESARVVASSAVRGYLPVERRRAGRFPSLSLSGGQ